MLDILRQCELIGDKLLVFSQSLSTLDLIEEFLAVEEQTKKKDLSSEAMVVFSISIRWLNFT